MIAESIIPVMLEECALISEHCLISLTTGDPVDSAVTTSNSDTVRALSSPTDAMMCLFPPSISNQWLMTTIQSIWTHTPTEHFDMALTPDWWASIMQLGSVVVASLSRPPWSVVDDEECCSIHWQSIACKLQMATLPSVAVEQRKASGVQGRQSSRWEGGTWNKWLTHKMHLLWKASDDSGMNRFSLSS